MTKDSSPEKIGDLLQQKPANDKKPPAYQWQDLALKVIEELNIPDTKRSAVFKVAKQYPRPMIEKWMNDTKELVQAGEQWRYFFKLVANAKNKPS